MNSVATDTAQLTEVFSSIQGEGPYVGARQIFVRFYGCHRRCEFCDSPETVTAWQPAGFQPELFRMELPPGSGRFQIHSNPVQLEKLLMLVAQLDEPRGLHHSVAITGGEPLLHAAFLREMMPRIRDLGMKTYLETAGDLYHELEMVLAFTDIVAMDIKLPSVTKNGPAWGHHKKFLQRCADAGVTVFAKAIVSGETSDDDIRESARIIASTAPDTLFVLQPLTPFGTARIAPTAGQLLRWQALANETAHNVRVIPQCHKMMGHL
jgi:organic radical activating enzyme